jgi:hypothetical protein
MKKRNRIADLKYAAGVESDPVMADFLGLEAAYLEWAPERLEPLTAAHIGDAREPIKKVKVRDDDILRDDIPF